MNAIDVVLLIALGGFMLAGLWFGVIHLIGSLVGLSLGAFVAGRFYPQFAVVVALFAGEGNLAKVISFILLFIVTTKLIGLAFHLLEKVFNFVAVIPFLKTFEHLLGAVLGLIEGILILGLAVYFAGKFPIASASEGLLAGSWMARLLNIIGGLLAPLLPKAVQALQSVF